jgi:hypothetical protein
VVLFEKITEAVMPILATPAISASVMSFVKLRMMYSVILLKRIEQLAA